MGVAHRGKVHFVSIYAHLSKVFVRQHERIERGQPIGLSGTGITPPWDHLHFGIIQPGGDWLLFSQTLDPKQFWLGGKPECFDRNRDYSHQRTDEITFPVACPDYRAYLIRNGKIPATGTVVSGCGNPLR